MTQSYWTPGLKLKEVKAIVIKEALIFHDGNKTHTAAALGMSIRTLRNWIIGTEMLREFYEAPSPELVAAYARRRASR
jgi:DNA-binding NtrC family response regulator